MKLIQPVFLSIAALAPAMAFAQLTGPGGSFDFGDRGWGVDEPASFAPNGGSNILSQNILYIQTSDGDPIDVYYTDPNPPMQAFSAMAFDANGQTVGAEYFLDDVLVQVSFYHNGPGDWQMLGPTVPDFYFMDVTVTNRTSGELDVELTNFWDFDISWDFPEDDLLELFTGEGGAFFTQWSPYSDTVAYFAGLNDTFTSGNNFDLWWELSSGSNYPLDNAVPGEGPDDYSFAYGYNFLLGAEESQTFSFAFGATVIPEPSLVGMLALPMIGSLLILRRRR